MTDPIAELLAWMEAKAPLASLPRWAAAVRELQSQLAEARHFQAVNARAYYDTADEFVAERAMVAMHNLAAAMLRTMWPEMGAKLDEAMSILQAQLDASEGKPGG